MIKLQAGYLRGLWTVVFDTENGGYSWRVNYRGEHCPAGWSPTWEHAKARVDVVVRAIVRMENRPDREPMFAPWTDEILALIAACEPPEDSADPAGGAGP